MGTHAAIIVKTPITGIVKGIYVHNDGYPEGVGRCLLEHYQDAEKIGALIYQGDRSTLEEEPNARKSYHIMNGERLKIHVGETVKEVASSIDWEYLYVWDGSWTCGFDGTPLVDVVTECDEDFREKAEREKVLAELREQVRILREALERMERWASHEETRKALDCSGVLGDYGNSVVMARVTLEATKEGA